MAGQPRPPNIIADIVMSELFLAQSRVGALLLRFSASPDGGDQFSARRLALQPLAQLVPQPLSLDGR
jgi:hypothetical protein